MGNTILKWNKTKYKSLLKYLNSLKDKKYKEFNSKIITTNYTILGIRIPILRNVAKEISKTEFLELFNITNYENYEITLIIGILISYIKDFKIMEEHLLNYTSHIDNWAICDTLVSSLKIIKTHKEEGFNLVQKLINQNKEYSIRLALAILLNYYIEGDLSIIFDIIKSIKYSTYYIDMAISWLLQVCFVYDKNKTYEFLKNGDVNDFILHKTISKINDSYKVSKEDKIWVKHILKD